MNKIISNITILFFSPLIVYSASANDDFPFAPGTLNGQNKPEIWSWQDVHTHRDLTIGNLDGATKVWEKDSAATPRLLGYPSDVENDHKTFETELDLTEVPGLFQVAIQVDDKATLIVKEIALPDTQQGGSLISKTYDVDGTALWNEAKSYKEFHDYLPAGRKYKFHLTYRNIRNLTGEHPAGYVDFDGVNVFLILQPIDLTLHRRGTINTPGSAIRRPYDNKNLYEVITLENADIDEQTNWTPDSMASAGETSRQDGATNAIDMERDDDFVKINLRAPLPRMPGSIKLVMDQSGEGDRMKANDLRFYNKQGQRVLVENLVIPDLQNPHGPLAPILQSDGLDLFIEIADLGTLTRAANQTTGNQRRYADLILRLAVDDRITEMRARIYRGGYWRNQRNDNAGTIAFYDGKGRYQDLNGAWQVDAGNLVHGPFAILSGSGTTNEKVKNRGPTPVGWYGLWERTDFRTWWEGRARPQTDHTIGRNGQQLGYLQQGSYCQWSGSGNRTTYTHQGTNASSSIRFKFELVPWGHNPHDRTLLQIHPDGFNDGTAGCVGIQTYNDCCWGFFFLRHYYGTQLNVVTP